MLDVPRDDPLYLALLAGNLLPVVAVTMGPGEASTLFRTAIRMSNSPARETIDGDQYEPGLPAGFFTFPEMGSENYRGLLGLGLIGSPPNSNVTWWQQFAGIETGLPIEVKIVFRWEGALTRSLTIYKGKLGGKTLVHDDEAAPAVETVWTGPLASKAALSVVIASMEQQRNRNPLDSSHDRIADNLDLDWGKE